MTDRDVATDAMVRFLASTFTATATRPLPQAHVLDGGGWWRTAVNKANPKSGEVHVYAAIGVDFFGEGVDANALISEIENMDVTELAVRINSPGGSAWDGLNIANAIMRHKANTTTYVDGLAASAASMIAVAGDKVVVSKYGQVMLHNARAMVMGTAKDMRDAAASLEKLNQGIANLYADRAGGDVTEWARAMAKETWYSGDEAVAAGLAHEVDQSGARDVAESAVASAIALAPANAFMYAGRPAAPPPVAGATQSKEPIVADSKALRESLGLPETATDDEVIAATRAALGITDEPDTTKAGDPPPAPSGAAPVPAVEPAAPEVAPAAAKVDGEVVALDRATYDQLIANSTAGANAAATLQAQADARVVDGAISTGRIMASRRDHYLTLMSADRADTTELLTTRLQPGAAVPLNPMGHADGPAPQASANTDDPRFVEWKVG